MKHILLLIVGCALIFTLSCSSAERKAQRSERRANQAQESVHQERLKLVEDYKKCLQKAGADKEKTEACDSYLRAAEALR